MSERKHGYGWVKDKPDDRDYVYNPYLVDGIIKQVEKEGNVFTNFWNWLVNLFKPKPTPTPSPCPGTSGFVDLRSQDSPIEDQGQLGSCTANAASGALQFLEIKDGIQDADQSKNFSRLYIYYNERVIEGTVSSDSGAEIRDSIKTMSQGNQGACYESTWPYDINKFAEKPSDAAYAEGENHEITQYFSITNLCDMKACLDAGFPFIFGFTVYASFESSQVAQTGVVPMPGALDYPVGGHAVMAIGYDDASERFIVRNSWGTGWGQQGYFTIPYAYLTNPALASDFWTVRRGTNMVEKPITKRDLPELQKRGLA